MAKLRIAKWGNSLALRLPVAFARQLELREGSPVVIAVEGNVLQVIVRSEEVPRLAKADLVKGLRMLKSRSARQRRTRLLDLGPPVGREV